MFSAELTEGFEPPYFMKTLYIAYPAFQILWHQIYCRFDTDGMSFASTLI